jgi:DNA-binding MarR family transcriptional regulator
VQSIEEPRPAALPPQPHPASIALREVAEASKDFETHVRHQLDVNATDLAAMEHLIVSGPLGPAELGRRLGLSRPAMTAVVDRLTALGHATRSEHPTDRRGVIVTPAPASVDQAMEILRPMIAEVDAALDGFTDEQQAAITEYLNRVVAAYRRHLD